MNKLLFTLVAISLLVGCGVNPDRMAALQERNEEMAESSSKEEAADVALEYDDSDPKGIRDSVVAIEDMRKNLESGDHDAYVARRYDVVTMLRLQASPDVQNNEKYPLLLNTMVALDKRMAASGGEKAVSRVGADRVTNTSADALYAVRDALDACERAVSGADERLVNELYMKYEASVQRAQEIDPNSINYVGKRATGTGVIDVPLEMAICEVRMAAKRIEAEDKPPEAADKSETYSGCGYYPIDIEAAQTGPNRFGEYQVTSFYAQDPEPGAAKSITCDKIPPMTDAPSTVKRVVQNKVRWLADEDIISMSGPFEYEQKTADALFKKGTVRIYRKDATLKTNRCGAQGDKVTCEAAGSDLARAYNHAQHYLDRADFHRKNGRSKRCKEMADRAYKAVNGPMTANDKEKMIQVRGGEKMTYPELSSRIEAMKSQANDALASNWCNQP